MRLILVLASTRNQGPSGTAEKPLVLTNVLFSVVNAVLVRNRLHATTMLDAENLKPIEHRSSATTKASLEYAAPTPTLQLVGGEVIHCGPENAVLRHVVGELLNALDSSSPVDSTLFPLVLYGDALCGKSMVAHGLANTWKKHHPKESTFVLTAADLSRSLKRTELADDIDRLTNQLRYASLLVIDDIQQLSGKKTVQSWLTNLLDYRNRHEKPVIVSCNTTINKSRIDKRLSSRLTSGLAIHISLPFAKTRKEVILKSAESFNLSLVDDDVNRLVEATSGRPVSSIQSVVASVATNNPSDDSTEPREIDSDSIDQDELIQKLIRSTGRRFGVKVADIRGPSRRKNCVLARAIAMFVIREITPLSLAEIGQLFRNRDHSTVLHACDKIRKQIHDDDSIREAITSICKSLNVRMPASWFELLDAG